MEMEGGYAAFVTRAGIPVVQMNYMNDVLQKVKEVVDRRSEVSTSKFH